MRIQRGIIRGPCSISTSLREDRFGVTLFETGLGRKRSLVAWELLQPGKGSSLVGKHLPLRFQAHPLLGEASARKSETRKVAAVAG